MVEITEITKRLFELQDEKYRDFQGGLIPDIEDTPMIGVRTPALRALAKELYGTELGEKFMANLPHRYYEENNLHAFMIERIRDYDECVRELEKFMPYVDNWATSDQMNPTVFTPAAEAYGLGVLPYFPLANGLLTGKYSSGQAPEGSRLTHSRKNLLEDANYDQLREFGDFARERGLSEVQVAFSWLASRPSVSSVIAGATKPEQVQQNAEAASWVPSEKDLEELDRIFPRTPKVALF